MKRFIVLYIATPKALASMANTTEEESAKDLERWFAWKNQLGEQLADFGSPLFGGSKVSIDGKTEASTQGISGFSIVLAEDMAGAIQLVEGHPFYGYGEGCGIEVHEAVDM